MQDQHHTGRQGSASAVQSEQLHHVRCRLVSRLLPCWGAVCVCVRASSGRVVGVVAALFCWHVLAEGSHVTLRRWCTDPRLSLLLPACCLSRFSGYAEGAALTINLCGSLVFKMLLIPFAAPRVRPTGHAARPMWTRGTCGEAGAIGM